MTDHYDALETRDPEAREHAVFERLPKQLAHAKAHAPAFAHLLADAGVNVAVIGRVQDGERWPGGGDEETVAVAAVMQAN